MRRTLLALLLLLLSGSSIYAQRTVHVRGYTRKDGTYVAPHTRTAPNRTTSDNYSTRGNVNPYTGEVGTKTPDAAPAPVPLSNYAPAPTQRRADYYSGLVRLPVFTQRHPQPTRAVNQPRTQARPLARPRRTAWPSGTSARCNDGSYSYSRNRSGTCSWHGGVARWRY